jgi:hypothetical protein
VKEPRAAIRAPKTSHAPRGGSAGAALVEIRRKLAGKTIDDLNEYDEKDLLEALGVRFGLLVPRSKKP